MKLSIVTTLYYSENYIHEFCERVRASVSKITNDYEIVFINDGSPDNSLQVVLKEQEADPKIIAVDLSRNFNHQRALMTGLQHAVGDFVFLIDSDLEEDPELLNLYWDELHSSQNIDVVYGVQQRRKGGFFERVTGRIWYKFFNFLSDIEYPTDSLTARLMTKTYVESVISFQEKELDLWGVFALAGFNQKTVLSPKKNKGSSTYTFTKKMRIVVDSITSFSSKPLMYIFFLGLFMTFISGIFITYLFAMKLCYGSDVTVGWTSMLVSLWFLSSLIIFCIGIIGIYLSKMFLEIKNRPLAIVRQVYRK